MSRQSAGQNHSVLSKNYDFKYFWTTPTNQIVFWKNQQRVQFGEYLAHIQLTTTSKRHILSAHILPSYFQAPFYHYNLIYVRVFQVRYFLQISHMITQHNKSNQV